MIKFHCDACGQKLGVAPEFAGKKVKCTQCGKAHIVPAGGEEMENKAYGEGYELGMLPEGAVKSDHKKTKEEIEAEIERESATLIGHGMIKCPHCGKAVKDTAKLCVNCGEFIKADGKHHKKKAKHKDGEVVEKAPKTVGGLTTAMVAGAIVALIGGAIWAGIVVVTGFEVGYVALGVGLVVGLTMVALAGGQGLTIGASAAGFAAAGLLVGKLLIFQWGVPSMALKDVMVEPGIETQLVMVDMLTDKAFSERVQTVLDRRKFGQPDADERELPRTIEEQMNNEIRARVSQLKESEKKTLAMEHVVKPLMASVPIADRIKSMLSFWDLLWFGLAVGTAFSIGNGKETTK